MTNINKNFEKIVNPTSDFLFTDDLLRNDKYIKAVYDKVFSELVRFIEKIKNITIQACALRKQSKTAIFLGKIHCGSKKHTYIVNINFNREIIEISINGKSLGESVIFGANINKETLSATKIKTDIATFKKSLSDLIN